MYRSKAPYATATIDRFLRQKMQGDTEHFTMLDLPRSIALFKFK